MNWTTGDNSGTTPTCEGSDLQYGITNVADGGRNFTGSVAAGSVVVTNTSGTFTTDDIGKIITGSGINSGWAILVSLSDSTHAVMTVAAASSFSGTLYLGGDTLVLAAGTKTWASTVTVPAGKALQITGAGVDVTTIAATNSSGALLKSCNPSNGDTFFLSGITFSWGVAGGSNSLVKVSCSNASGYPKTQFRVTNCKFNSSFGTVNPRLFVAGASYGVVDNCVFIYSLQQGQMVDAEKDNPYSSTSNTYHTPQSYGDMKTVVFEKCVFNTNNSGTIDGTMDGFTGGKMCFRYNQINNGGGDGWHGLDSSPRSFRLVEYYQNTRTCHIDPGCVSNCGINGQYGLIFRGGTGMVWGNTFSNDANVSANHGIIGFIVLKYARAYSPYEIGDGSNNGGTAPSADYPIGPWGQANEAYSGTTTISDGSSNRITGLNPIDGNVLGPLLSPWHMDPAYTIPLSDVISDGSSTISSAGHTWTFSTTDFSTDNFRYIFTNSDNKIAKPRIVTDATVSGNTLTSAAAQFTQGDVGRYVRASANIVNGIKIVSVSGNTATLSGTPTAGTNLHYYIGGAYVVSVSGHNATLNCNVPSSNGAGQSVTVGLTDQGYPALDQEGYGSFPTPNADNWPNNTSYSATNYEQLDPIYTWNNKTVIGGATNNFPTCQVGEAGALPYIKPNREYYNHNSSWTPGNPVTSGVAAGVLTNMPASGNTEGVGYFATDDGPQGALYVWKNGAWFKKYIPLAYPHPFVTNMTQVITTNLLARYQADSLSLNDGANVGSVMDSSGNGNTLTGGGSVVFKTNIINGKPVMRFNGTANSKFTLTGVSVGTNHTFFVVVSESSQASFAGLFGSSGNNGIYLTNGKFNYYYSGSHLANSLLANNTFFILEGACSNGSVTYYRNGSADGTASSFPGLTATRIGNTLVGDIAEILDYGTISASDRSTIRQYLGNKYAIPVTP